jgi:hypothetical protein
MTTVHEFFYAPRAKAFWVLRLTSSPSAPSPTISAGRPNLSRALEAYGSHRSNGGFSRLHILLANDSIAQE